MRCTNCGNEAPEGATQCPSCGARLEPAPSNEGWGSAVPTGWGQPSTPSPPPPFGGAPGPAPAYPPPPSGYQQQAPSYPPPNPGGWSAGGGYPAPPPAWDGGQPLGGGRVGSLAGWWYRVGATVIDGIILLVINTIIGAALGRAGEFSLGVVIAIVYFGFLLSNRGQTVGMMAVGTRLIREQTGQYVSVGAAIGRYLLSALLEITVIGGILDILWPLWDAKNQTIHDKAVGSLIVHAR